VAGRPGALCQDPEGRAAHGLQGGAGAVRLQVVHDGPLRHPVQEHVLDLGADETQKVARRALQAVEQYAVGVRGRPHFQRTTEFDSIEGKKNSAGLRFKAGALEWFGLRLPILFDPVDRKAWQAEALRRSTKFRRVLRRRVRGVDPWYVQLVQEGRSPLVPATVPVVGLDFGPSTVAVVGASDALPAPLCPGVVLPWKEPRQLRPARSGEEGRPKVEPVPALPAPGREAARTRASPGPLSASGRTANSPTASSVRATSSRRRRSPPLPSRSRLAGRSRSAPRAASWPSSGRRRLLRAAIWWSSRPARPG